MATNLAQTLKGCRSWGDLQRRWRPLTKKQKGDLFEDLTKYYLLLEPEYATKLKSVWLLREVPTSLARKLKLPSDDQGIDLLAVTKEGEYWAIQSKYREESDQSITWREISTFTGLAFGVCRGFSYGLIASTTERITNVLKHQDRIGFAALDVWQRLDEEFFNRLQQHLHHKREVLKPRLPRPHQNQAIADAFTYFVKKKHKRGKLIMPCGTGKSLTSYFIAQELKARKIVIAVPSLSLIKQTLKTWMYESMARKQGVEWICVCSDESAGKVEQDDAVVLKQDLGVPCLTNSKEITDWLKRKHSALTIVFTTYQSGQALAKAARNAGFTFDLGIMDEAHKTAGAKDRLFSHLILDKNIKIDRRLFMTATERRYRGESDEILSMEDPDDYGETIHKLSFKRALEYKPAILSDYKIVTIHITQEEIADLVRNRAFVRPKTKGWSKEMEAENLAALIALRKAMNKYPIRHAVSFHGSIRRAEDFKESNDSYSKSFPSSGRLQTFHVSGKTPTGTRAKEIDEFSKATRSLITNARCLTEGVDVPNIDAILFADPRRSLVDIVQAVGRALRPSQNKKFGYVIVPVVHDKNAKPDAIIALDSFKEVLATIRALGSQDESLIEYFRLISQGKRPSGRSPFEGVLTEKLAESVDLKEFVESVELRCWDRLAKLSWRPFEEAKRFVHELGIKTVLEWREIAYGGPNKRKVTLPSDIPVTPESVYKDFGWKGYGDWIGTGRIGNKQKRYWSFEKARRFVRRLGLRTQNEWKSYIKGKTKKLPKKPLEIPNAPHGVYKEWVNLGDWLGTGYVSCREREYLPFVKARSIVRKKKLRTVGEWRKLTKQKTFSGLNIPAAPEAVYKNEGWAGLPDWLGNGNPVKGEFWPFVKARKYVRGLRLKSIHLWHEMRRGEGGSQKYLPAFIPKAPHVAYKNSGWKGYGDWLGTGYISPQRRKWRSLAGVIRFMKNKGIKSGKEWYAFCRGSNNCKGKGEGQNKIPVDIPVGIPNVYRNKGFKGWHSIFGDTSITKSQREYLSFEVAKKLLKKYKFSSTQYRLWSVGRLKGYTRKPSNLPSCPEKVYKNSGWKGMGDFLGTNRKRRAEVSTSSP